MMHHLKHSTIERLMHYYHSLEGPSDSHSEWITSSTIASCFNMDDTLVRKDLAEIGVKGRPRQGFRRQEVLDAIRGILGLTQEHRAAIVGVGRLGGAILEYPNFHRHGLLIVALFDIDPRLIGSPIAGRRVYSGSHIVSVCEEKKVRLGILTCPPEVSQGCAEQLIEGGVTAIWNFSAANLLVPKHVRVRNEHLSVGLAELTYWMNGHT